MQNLITLETDFLAAKASLQNAQQEKLEAATEFLKARTELRQALETLWPGQCDCGEMEYRGDAAEQRKNSVLAQEAEHQQVMVAMT